MATMHECAMKRKQEIADLIGEVKFKKGTLATVIENDGTQQKGEAVNTQTLGEMLIEQANTELQLHITHILKEMEADVAEVEKRANERIDAMNAIYRDGKKEIRVEAKMGAANINMIFCMYRSIAHNLSNGAHIRSKAYVVALKNTLIGDINNWFK